MVFGAGGLLWLLAQSLVFEQQALQKRGAMAAVMALLGVAAIAVRLQVRALAKSDERDLQVEEEPVPAVLELGLFRDGATIVAVPIRPQLNVFLSSTHLRRR